MDVDSESDPASRGVEQPASAARPTVAPGPMFVAVPQPGNGLAVAGMILGITSIIFCWLGLLALLQIVLALTFSSIGINAASRGAPHKGMAVAGLTCGLVGLILYVVLGVASLGAGFFV